MQMVGNFEAKRNLYFMTPPCLKIILASLSGADCSQHNVLYYECYHCQTNIFSQSYLSFLSSVIIRISQYIWSKQKWFFWRAGFFPPNQNFLNTFSVALIGRIKAGLPTKPLLFWLGYVNRLNIVLKQEFTLKYA